MAKGSRKRSRAMKAVWRARKAAGKLGPLGRTRRKARRARKASAPKRRRGRRISVSHRKKLRAGQRRYWAARRKARKHGRPGHTKRRARSRRRTARLGTRRRGRQLAIHPAALTVLGPTARTVRANPSRRRRRRRTYRTMTVRRRRRRTYRVSAPRRRRRRHSARRIRRGYHRRYRRNPGLNDLKTMLVSLAKDGGVAALGMGVTNLINTKVVSMLPLSMLGTLQGPVGSLLSLIGTHFLVGVGAKHSALVARHRSAAMIGAGASTVVSLLKAFAPSISSTFGLGDYVQMGDYVAVGATPLRENFTLSDYVAVGSDGVSEELGLEEELGVEEELGAYASDGYLGGMPGGPRLMKQVPTQQFLAPVPARSFTKQIPAAGTAYDTASDVYTGIFAGQFGR